MLTAYTYLWFKSHGTSLYLQAPPSLEALRGGGMPLLYCFTNHWSYNTSMSAGFNGPSPIRLREEHVTICPRFESSAHTKPLRLWVIAPLANYAVVTQQAITVHLILAAPLPPPTSLRQTVQPLKVSDFKRKA